MGENTWEIYDLWQDGRNTACLGKLLYFSDQSLAAAMASWLLPVCTWAHARKASNALMLSGSNPPANCKTFQWNQFGYVSMKMGSIIKLNIQLRQKPWSKDLYRNAPFICGILILWKQKCSYTHKFLMDSQGGNGLQYLMDTECKAHPL